MRYDPNRHHRRSIRLKGYDYSRPGYYYVTICTQMNAGTSLVGVPNDANDIHINPHKTGELAINRTGTRPVPTLFEIIGAFKSITTNRYINCVKQNNWPRFRKRLWQLQYHDRIIRDENELGRIRKYIINNPLN